MNSLNATAIMRIAFLSYCTFQFFIVQPKLSRDKPGSVLDRILRKPHSKAGPSLDGSDV